MEGFRFDVYYHTPITHPYVSIGEEGANTRVSLCKVLCLPSNPSPLISPSATIAYPNLL